ncbi:hypothetical protein AYI68_g1157 [Smittium mucronatum]|uniref:Succinylglutamate desuccinylase/Aspartoacylase catalytic domain-containing protein n=1 Tax=Smittium mucronatum TaxID=133383 RepID=A0A1R0H6D2_9FUNG|nr:hypothetical protein AYI68_g1157 [Smittium mucronatum]
MVRVSFLFSSFLLALSSSAQTVYTGESLDGFKVASRIDVSDLPLNSLTKVFLRMPKNQIGQNWFVPVMVAKGQNDGKRLFLNSGIHGDGLNGIRVIQRVINDLDTSKMSGVVVGIPGANVNGMLQNKHRFVSMSGSGSLTDLNQYFPGDTTYPDDVYQYVGTLWEDLIFNNNFTAAVDFQTQATGNTASLNVDADVSVPYVQKMVDLSGADVAVTKAADPESGALDDNLTNVGVAALTYTLAGPRVFDAEPIQRGYDFAQRLISDLNIHSAANTTLSASSKMLVTDTVDTFYAQLGGFVETHVELLDSVTEGQVLATMYDPHGDIIDETKALHSGIIMELMTDPLREPGALIASVAVSKI